MAKNVPEQGRTGKKDLEKEARKEAGRRAKREAARKSGEARRQGNSGDEPRDQGGRR